MVAKTRTQLSDFTFAFHFHALEKEMAIHSSVLAWRIPGTTEPGGLPSMGSRRVRHDWSDLAAAAGSLQGKPGNVPWSICCCVSLPIKWKKWTKVSQIFISSTKWISLCIYQVLCIGQRTHIAFTKGIPNCLQLMFSFSIYFSKLLVGHIWINALNNWICLNHNTFFFFL